MRTFHIGGAAQINEQSFIESNFEGTVKIKNRNVAAQLRRRSDRDGPQHDRRGASIPTAPSGPRTASSTARG